MKNLILLISFLFVSLHSFGLSIRAAVQKLKENNYTEARSELQELQKNDSFQAMASLVLALIDNNNGKYKDAFTEFRRFYQSHPQPDPYLYALIHSKIFQSFETKDDKEVILFLKRVLDDPNTDEALKSCIISHLGAVSENDGDMDAVIDRYAQLHNITNWSTLGTFENVSGSGFNKDFGALDHPEGDYQYYNNISQPVKWFNILAPRTDHWLDMNNYHDANNAIIYAQSFIESGSNRDVILLAGASGSLKIWVNDFLVVSEEEERNTNADVFQVRVKLNEGNNRILVQTGSSEIDQNKFMIRFADQNGRLINNITSTPREKPYKKATPYNVEKIAFYPEYYFEKLVAKDSSDWVSKLMLLLVYASNQNAYPAHKTLSELQRLSPKSTFVAVEAMAIAKADKDELDANKIRESIKTNDSDSFKGLRIKYQDALSAENYDEALYILDKRLRPMGESAAFFESMADLYEKWNKMSRSAIELEVGYEKYPEYEPIVINKYNLVLNGTGGIHKADEILSKYLKNKFSINLIDLLIDGEIKVGQKAEAEEWIKKEIAVNPSEASLYLKLANCYFIANKNDKALEVLNNCFSLCPYNSDYYYYAGRVYEAMGNVAFAKKMLQLSIQYGPSNFEARESLRSLESKKKLKDYFKQNDALKIYQEARTNNNYKNEDAIILLNDQRQIVYSEQGAEEEQLEKLMLINSQSALAAFKEYTIPNYIEQNFIVDKAELLKPDGNRVPAEQHKGRCVFSSLAIGDAIHLYYRFKYMYSGKLAQHFWNQMNFNDIYPTEVARFSLIVPENRKFQTFTSSPGINHTDTTLDGYKLMSWEQVNLPKISPEVSMDYPPFAKVLVTSIPDWSYIANWYSDISLTKSKAKFEVKEVVQQLLAGHENAGDLDKARIIYEYIENNYNYSSVSFLQSGFIPQSATRTMTRKMGDCKDLSTLFVSMTREAGLNSNLVLVRTNDAGDGNLELPRIAFNHCIAQLHAEGRDYYVEMTNNYLPFGAIGSGDYQAFGLPIPYFIGANSKADLQKISSPNRPANANVRKTNIQFIDDHATLHRVVDKLGAETVRTRANYRDADSVERLNSLTSYVHDELKKEIKIRNLKLVHLNDLNDTLHLEYDVDVSHFSSELLGMKVFRLPWTDANLVENLFSLPERKLPLNLKSLSCISYFTEQIEVAIPPGKKLAERPKDVHLTDSVFEYSLTYKVTGKKLVAVRNIKVLKDAVAPEDYTAVRDIANKISQADQMDLALK